MRTSAVACLLLFGTNVALARAEPTPVDGDAAFAAALHRQLATAKGNLFYSPASARMALAMVAAGARGATAAELAKALSLPPGPETARRIQAQMAGWAERAHATGPDSVVLRVVNHVWTQHGSPLLPDFVRTTREQFHAPITDVDFARSAETAALINQWVADATANRIPSLIGPDKLTSYTKMVLTNAVYLNAHWKMPFDPHATHDEPFFVAGDKPVSTPMMHLEDSMQVARVDGALVLELPYSDEHVVLDVVLPTAKNGIAAIEAAYAKGALAGWLKALGDNRVDISLPKLKMSSSQDLKWVLRGLGVVHATDCDSADFSGIDGGHKLFITDFVQKAIVELDEVHTEAAAATEVEAGVPMAAMPPPPPIVFRADHPFLFVIRDTTQSSILFAGRVVDPTAH